MATGILVGTLTPADVDIFTSSDSSSSHAEKAQQCIRSMIHCFSLKSTAWGLGVDADWLAGDELGGLRVEGENCGSDLLPGFTGGPSC